MDRQEHVERMKRRTRQFALDVMALADSLPRTPSAGVIARQMAASGTSVGANYRAACRGRSRAEFIAKMGIEEEESDETAFWLDLCVAAKYAPASRVEPLIREANELTAISVTAIRTARAGGRR